MMVDMQLISFDLITSSCFKIQGRVGGRQYAVHVKSAIVQSFDGLEVAYYIYTTVHFNVPKYYTLHSIGIKLEYKI